MVKPVSSKCGMRVGLRGRNGKVCLGICQGFQCTCSTAEGGKKEVQGTGNLMFKTNTELGRNLLK